MKISQNFSNLMSQFFGQEFVYKVKIRLNFGFKVKISSNFGFLRSTFGFSGRKLVKSLYIRSKFDLILVLR